MFKKIKQLKFAWQYKRAVKRATHLSHVTGLKYFVILLGGELKVVPKKTMTNLIARRRFRKGVTIADIEKKALFVTH